LLLESSLLYLKRFNINKTKHTTKPSFIKRFYFNNI